VGNLNSWTLEQEIAKLTMAIRARNTEICQDLMTYIRIQSSSTELAGVMLITLERLISFDPELVSWAVADLVPADVMQEIRDLASVALYRQFIQRGFTPGVDLSVDARGKILVKREGKAIGSHG